MLTKVEVRNDLGALLTLPLQDISEGYVIKDIDGLDPVKATIVSSSFAQLDGSQYQSARRENRNIVLKLGYEPDFVSSTVGELRARLYGFFMPKTNVRLRFFEDSGLVVEIAGRVESFDSPRFTKDPDANISIINFDPNFASIIPKSFSGNTTASLTDTQPVRQYDGTVETGFLFTLNVNRSLSGFTIYSRVGDAVAESLVFAAPLLNGDVLRISTLSGSKSATLTRGGAISSILYGVSPMSSWLNLFPGPNTMRVYAPGAVVPWTLDYTDKYGGL